MSVIVCELFNNKTTSYTFVNVTKLKNIQPVLIRNHFLEQKSK